MGAAIETEIYTYVDLHRVAKLMVASERRRKYGKYDCALSALVFSAFFLEAYLNYVGSQVLPEWSDAYERHEPKDKLKRIASVLGFPLNLQSSQYHSFTCLFRIRNTLAHGKLVKLKAPRIPKKIQNQRMVFLETEWEKATQSGTFRKYFADAEGVVIGLHQRFAPGRNPFAISASSTW
jgi:hypothetical protein